MRQVTMDAQFGAEIQLTALLNVLIAIALGAIVGYERERAGKPAGLRTHMLVCGASALFVHLGKYISPLIRQYEEDINMDPSRILHSIILGISFIGAGVIFQNDEKGKVENLTTAASLWFITGVGIAVGMDLYYIAVGATLIGFSVNHLVGLFERHKMGVEKERAEHKKENSSPRP
jgi:putative Mg2+ transporter-C (MgtC) family protein